MKPVKVISYFVIFTAIFILLFGSISYFTAPDVFQFLPVLFQAILVSLAVTIYLVLFSKYQKRKSQRK